MKYSSRRSLLADAGSGIIPGDIDPLSLSPECLVRFNAIVTKVTSGQLPTAEEMAWLEGLKSNPACFNTGIKPPDVTVPTSPTPGTPATPTFIDTNSGLPWWGWALVAVGGLWLISKA